MSTQMNVLIMFHTGPSPGARYTSWSSVFHTYSILNSGHYITVMLKPVALSFIRALRNAMFQQGNARLHVTDIV